MRGKRVLAWKGEHTNRRGVVVRMDGVYHCYVRFDGDSFEESCSSSDLILETMLADNSKIFS